MSETIEPGIQGTLISRQQPFCRNPVMFLKYLYNKTFMKMKLLNLHIPALPALFCGFLDFYCKMRKYKSGEDKFYE